MSDCVCSRPSSIIRPLESVMSPWSRAPVTRPSDKMVLQCQHRPQTSSPRFILKSDGSVVEDRGEDDQMFDIGECGTTEMLLPENFVMNTKPCPKHHQCFSNIKVAYKVLEAIEQTKEYEYALTQDLFKSMICSREPQKRALCLPKNKTNPVTEENLFNSLQIPELICMKNPCPAGQQPYQAEKGYFRCNKTSGLRSFFSTGSNLCPRNKIFRRGRCMSKYFG